MEEFMMSEKLEKAGFEVVRGVMSEQARQHLLEILGPVAGAGRRGLLNVPAVAELARSAPVLALIQAHLAGPAVPVRAIYFDKSPETNWLVPWHQDLTVAVRERREIAGFGPWSVKAGIPHVQPPVSLLEQMLTLRFHLDDADESNGALRVLPGTHCLGRLSAQRIEELRVSQAEHLCAVAAGDVLLMRPLLLHASSRSSSPRHRRILHLEYAGFTLPEGLEWDEAGS